MALHNLGSFFAVFPALHHHSFIHLSDLVHSNLWVYAHLFTWKPFSTNTHLLIPYLRFLISWHLVMLSLTILLNPCSLHSRFLAPLNFFLWHLSLSALQYFGMNADFCSWLYLHLDKYLVYNCEFSNYFLNEWIKIKIQLIISTVQGI